MRGTDASARLLVHPIAACSMACMSFALRPVSMREGEAKPGPSGKALILRRFPRRRGWGYTARVTPAARRATQRRHARDAMQSRLHTVNRSVAARGPPGRKPARARSDRRPNAATARPPPPLLRGAARTAAHRDGPCTGFANWHPTESGHTCRGRKSGTTLAGRQEDNTRAAVGSNVVARERCRWRSDRPRVGEWPAAGEGRRADEGLFLASQHHTARR